MKARATLCRLASVPALLQKATALLLPASVLLMTACGHYTTNKCELCPEAPELQPYLNFRVVDKTTGHDLFFGANANYKTSQLTLNHLVNGQAQPIQPIIDTAAQYFHFFVATVHNTDTITMNIATLPQDTFLFKTHSTGGCCMSTVFDAVLFDGNVVYTPSGGPNVVVIDK
ncbi:MAG TPA: hypothetical protein VFE53_16055 [Mucilaginibacter sp.]|jgi:hypothetical protein|nr:hypothetical protein [Mucilaginibacter sp.]